MRDAERPRFKRRRWSTLLCVAAGVAWKTVGLSAQALPSPNPNDTAPRYGVDFIDGATLGIGVALPLPRSSPIAFGFGLGVRLSEGAAVGIDYGILPKGNNRFGISTLGVSGRGYIGRLKPAQFLVDVGIGGVNFLTEERRFEGGLEAVSIGAAPGFSYSLSKVRFVVGIVGFAYNLPTDRGEEFISSGGAIQFAPSIGIESFFAQRVRRPSRINPGQ